ncbi:MAG: imidazole glycerol phosphate synthase subunit HisF [Phycisphaerae bacterium]|jgi:imidazoleglycerol phosphate synthase cyclase subunit
MLTVRIIPCLDVSDGRVVKGVRFDRLRDVGSPADLAGRYERQGADEIVLLDVSATPQTRSTCLETVRQVRERLAIPLTVGGGVRSVADAAALLEAGADRVAINTAAVRQPELIGEMAARFGRQCIVVSLDAARSTQDGWEVLVCSGRERTGIDAIDWARNAQSQGAGEILLTSWDRDGTQAGYDLELLAAASAALSVPIIASGGAAGTGHLLAAVRAGADAVLAASIFHDERLMVSDVKAVLRDSGVEVRL